MNLSIRHGTVDDLTSALDVWNEAHSARLGIAYVSADMFFELETKRLLARDAAFLVIEEGGSIVGFALACPAREDDGDGAIIPGLAHIGSVAVNSSYWGRGVGRTLMNAVIDKIRALGYKDAQLWTQPSNSRALKLYLSLGFIFTGDEKDMHGERIRRYRLSLYNEPRSSN